MDLVVDHKVLVEAKTVERFVDVHFAQVNSYLCFSGLGLGLLLNFRTWPLKDGGIKRVIRSNH
jgi:GxxExxY protein